MKSVKAKGAACCLVFAVSSLLILGTALEVKADYHAGLSYFKAKKYNEALTEFRKQIDITPTWHYSRYMAGICLLKLKKLDEAAATLEEAMVYAESDKDRFKNLDGLGKLYAAKKQYDKALAKFNETQAFAVPDRMKFAVHEQCGDIYLKKKAHKEAETAFAKAASLEPTDKDIQYKLGLVRLRLQNFDGAIAALEKAHSGNPKKVRWMERLGNAYLARAIRTQDTNKKREYYSKAAALSKKGLAVQPSSFEMNELLGNAELGLQRYDSAIGVLSRAVSMKPDYGHAYYNLAQAYAAKKDYPSAESNLKKARNLMPKDAAVFSSLGYVYEKQKRLEESKSAYEVAYKLHSSSFNKRNLERVVRNIAVRDENQSIDQDNQKIELLNTVIELENQRIEMENVEAQRINAIIEQEFGEDEKEEEKKKD